jgi:hypothetical protein
MPEGAEVVFEGEADESPDWVAGDVIVRVKSKKVKGGFVRKESNLYWKEPISVAEALLGFRHTVKGLDGHDIVLQRQGVTQPGSLAPLLSLLSSRSLVVLPQATSTSSMAKECLSITSPATATSSWSTRSFYRRR